jgi:hypothetical protein
MPTRESAVRPVPRETAGRELPISLELSPRFAVLPSPSCPLELRPQHFSLPVELTAQGLERPPAMEARLVVAALTVILTVAAAESAVPSLMRKVNESAPV